MDRRNFFKTSGTAIFGLTILPGAVEELMKPIEKVSESFLNPTKIGLYIIKENKYIRVSNLKTIRALNITVDRQIQQIDTKFFPGRLSGNILMQLNHSDLTIPIDHFFDPSKEYYIVSPIINNTLQYHAALYLIDIQFPAFEPVNLEFAISGALQIILKNGLSKG